MDMFELCSEIALLQENIEIALKGIKSEIFSGSVSTEYVEEKTVYIATTGAKLSTRLHEYNVKRGK